MQLKIESADVDKNVAGEGILTDWIEIDGQPEISQTAHLVGASTPKESYIRSLPAAGATNEGWAENCHYKLLHFKCFCRVEHIKAIKPSK